MRANRNVTRSDDGVGLSVVHIADALGANVIAVDLVDEKLSKAEELGAVVSETGSLDDVPEKLAARRLRHRGIPGIDAF